MVDTGQAELCTFSTRHALAVPEGAHIYVRMMWIDEADSSSRWVSCSLGTRSRLTLVTKSDVEGDGSDEVLTAPQNAVIGIVSTLDDLPLLSVKTPISTVREMLVISPGLIDHRRN